MTFTRGLKIWIFISLCSLLVWLVYFIPSSFYHFFNVILGKPDFYTGNLGMFMASHVGLIARFLGVLLALTVGFLLWGGGEKTGYKVDHLVEATLFLEGTYFILLFPTGLWWLGLGINFLGIAYLFQAGLTGSALMILSFKVRDFAHNIKVLKWVGIAAFCYVGALWLKIVFTWFDMIAVLGDKFLLRGATAWGFLGSLITMDLALVFAGFGAYLIAKNKGDSIWWFGFALSMVGIHYIIYLVYSFVMGALDSAMFMDVWTLPLLGLGTVMLRMKISKDIR